MSEYLFIHYRWAASLAFGRVRIRQGKRLGRRSGRRDSGDGLDWGLAACRRHPLGRRSLGRQRRLAASPVLLRCAELARSLSARARNIPATNTSHAFLRENDHESPCKVCPSVWPRCLLPLKYSKLPDTEQLHHRPRRLVAGRVETSLVGQ